MDNIEIIMDNMVQKMIQGWLHYAAELYSSRIRYNKIQYVYLLYKEQEKESEREKWVYLVDRSFRIIINIFLSFDNLSMYK